MKGYATMLMKTKDRFSTDSAEAEKFNKTRHLSRQSRHMIEKKAVRWNYELEN